MTDEKTDSEVRRGGPVPPRPLTEQGSHDVLVAAAWGTAAIGLVALILEIMTGAWLAEASGLGFFVSAPLGAGMVILTLLVSRSSSRKALFPGICSVMYWILFFVFL